MTERMRNHMVDGDYHLHADEYLEPSQIRNIISKISMITKFPHNQPESVAMYEYDGIGADMHDIGLQSDDEEFHVFLMRYRRSQHDVPVNPVEEDVFDFE